MKESVKNLIGFFGTQGKTAQKLGVAQATVSCWASGKHGISAIHALRAEQATRGEIKASDLCPALADLGQDAKEVA